MKKKLCLSLLFAVIGVQIFYSQNNKTNTTSDSISNKKYSPKTKEKPALLNEVIINANHLPTQLKRATSSTALISNKAIERANNTNINEALNRVSGVFMQSGALNTNRITIRGVGSRNLFGTSKIRAYFKDIPRQWRNEFRRF